MALVSSSSHPAVAPDHHLINAVLVKDVYYLDDLEPRSHRLCKGTRVYVEERLVSGVVGFYLTCGDLFMRLGAEEFSFLR